MNTQTSSRQKPPLSIGLTILHLLAYGVIGFGLVVGGASYIAISIGLIPLAGIGLVMLVGAVYALFGIGWFETRRVSELYDLGIPDLRFTRREIPTFGGWLKAVLRQSVDARMWRALANSLLTIALGFVLLVILQWVFQTSFDAVQSLIWGNSAASSGVRMGIAVAGFLFWLGTLYGAAMLHRLLSIALIGSAVREAELEERAAASQEQRKGAVRAADLERTRVERDLHDGVQPRLVSTAMTLGLAKEMIDTDPETAKTLVAEAHTSTKAAITELRQLARGIYASVLDDRGLDAALSALAARSHIPVTLDVQLTGRCSRTAEAAVYFVIAESLTNAAKHSRASECRVIVRLREDGTLWARIEDNGIGGATLVPGGGLDGVQNRVLAAGGTSTLASPKGGPTTLEVSVPCAS
ncbi:sensor domain-containing protein [Leucobacter sp. cx-328]|uniref:sensor histidine kinase n=1 Tax=unclassified Leucobacter TaxID=2621730 RepID=UPI00165E45DC|nr:MULTISPECIES: histidine kinase [unclassified Leucobacter]MBC9943464.1 sensor domain-containing protein [Leucobacter sp. cx-328]